MKNHKTIPVEHQITFFLACANSCTLLYELVHLRWTIAVMDNCMHDTCIALTVNYMTE